MTQKRVLLIIPAYNEEQNILRVIQKVRDYRVKCPYQLDYVVINDGSGDLTEQVCREHGIHCISLLQNLGIGGAVQTGDLYAKRRHYEDLRFLYWFPFSCSLFQCVPINEIEKDWNQIPFHPDSAIFQSKSNGSDFGFPGCQRRGNC